MPSSPVAAHDPRILVLRGGAIGDFVVTFPALRLLRERWPGAHLELVCYPHLGDLARAGGLADRVDSLDRASMASLFVPQADLEPALRERIRTFDVVVSYLYDPDEVVRSNLLRAGAGLVVYGSPLVEQGHAIDRLLEPLGELALFEDHAYAQVRLDAQARREGTAWLANEGLSCPLALHPGSGSPAKNWPVQNFVELARRAVASGRTPFFIAGEADAELVPVLKADAPGVPLLTGKTLVQVGGVLSACESFVGNDSGITHLAAAVGTTVLALFGPSRADQWAPRGPHVTVLRAPDGCMAEIAVTDVADSIGMTRDG